MSNDSIDQTVKVSVLIPAYESEKTIHKAVESALLNLGVEVVIAPDDGTHHYDKLETQYAGRVIVLSPSYRTGPGSARNRAFAASSGEFITMLDDDDYFEDNAIHEALELAQKNPAKVAFFRTVYKYERSGETCRELPFSQSISYQTFIDFHGSIHALYERALWRPYSDHRISQDVLFDANILLASGGVAPLTQAAHVKTLNPESITWNSDQSAFNTEYQEIINSDAHHSVRQLFHEKLQIGVLYAKKRSNGFQRSFHEFMMDRALMQ